MVSRIHLLTPWIWMTVLIAIFFQVSVNSQLYSAIAGMEKMVETESALLKVIAKVISSTEASIEEIKRQVAEYREASKEATANVDEYLANPLNIYILMKRLIMDWQNTFSELTDLNEYLNNVLDHYQRNLTFPSLNDYKGAIFGLTRLQELYKLDTVLSASEDGIHSTKMSAKDCFQLGKVLYSYAVYEYSEEWLNEAVKRFDEENSMFKRWEVREYLANIAYKMGNLSKAIDHINEILTEVPDHKRALKNRLLLNKKLDKKNNEVT